MMPADGFELPYGRDSRHERRVALTANLGRGRAAGVADDSDVLGLDGFKSHGKPVHTFRIRRK
jgi:hypothetical protein